jgi:hypothetical protein
MNTEINKLFNFLKPSEEYKIQFPENFTLTYIRQKQNIQFNPNYCLVYFRDEDDYWGLDYFLYDNNNSDWVCKLYELNYESLIKLKEYLKTLIIN